jgi:hypothetical protein
MSDMFKETVVFNQPLGDWNVSTVTDMSSMFEDAVGFNQPLANWERAGSSLSNVTRMDYMFEGAVAFNQPIGGWDVSGVTDMSDMFKETVLFNQPLGDWNVSNVIRMDGMFEDAVGFNQPLANWERAGSSLSNVTRMDGMFEGANAFNQSIGNWNVSNVTRMDDMFFGADVFDQSLGTWSLNANVDMFDMFDESGMSSSCYDATLIGWAALDPAVNNRNLGQTSRTYSPAGASARAILVDQQGWTIAGDSLVANATGGCATPQAPHAPQPLQVDDTQKADQLPASQPPAALSCAPDMLPLRVGALVTCTVAGGAAGQSLLWQASYNPVFANGSFTLNSAGAGTFQFTIPGAAHGQNVLVELEGNAQAVSLGVVGDLVPTSIPAGNGPHPVWPFVVLVAAVAASYATKRVRLESPGNV